MLDLPGWEIRLKDVQEVRKMTNQESFPGVTGEYTVNGLPKGYTAITPFIVVSDPAGAIAFYETVFGAKAKNVTEFGEEGSKQIIHADLDFGNGYLQLGAANPAYQLVMPPGEGKACYSLGLYVSDVDRTLKLAAANGATVRESRRILFQGTDIAASWIPSAFGGRS